MFTRLNDHHYLRYLNALLESSYAFNHYGISFIFIFGYKCITTEILKAQGAHPLASFDLITLLSLYLHLIECYGGRFEIHP